MESTTVYISQDPKLLRWSNALQLLNACFLIFWSYQLSRKYGGWILAAGILMVICAVVVLFALRGRDRLRVTFTEDDIQFQLNFKEAPTKVEWSDVKNIKVGTKKVELAVSGDSVVEIPLEAMYEITTEIKDQFRARANEKGISIVG